VRASDEDDLDGWTARLADGDRAAFEPLFRALHPRALRAARSRLDSAHADDVAQATLVNIFSRASEFEAGRAVLPWFYAFLANEIRNAERRSRREVSGDVPESISSSEEDPERRLLREEMERALTRAIDDLDETSAAAIASFLGRAPPPLVPAQTFRKRLSRAVAKLRILVGGHR
jgi:RNA polymerase sigma factor (sigma-70 family)